MWRVLFCALAALCVAPCTTAATELFDRNGQPITISPTTVPPCARPPGLRKQPVLFVHGHAADTSSDPNYKKNFWEDADDDFSLALFDLTSFKSTLDDNINSGLDIEPYYIRFADRIRSITDDAFDIGEAVDCIIQRHNESFDPAAAAMPPPVQVAIIAYSKGTISTRQYLKSLQQQVQDNGGISLPPPRPGYRPVSEFIAVAPPNHGIASSLFDEATDQISVQQLYNGVQPEGNDCGNPFTPLHPQAANFMEILNGEAALESQVSNAFPVPAEAPGSRASNQGPHSGTLYVTVFANASNPDDLVGGDGASGDCAGRARASNLSPQAINIPIGIPGGPLTVHRNTVHEQNVICKALFVVVHHRPPVDEPCVLSGRVPIIPLPQPAAAMLALDISGSMLARECATCPTRYDILKQAVEIFAQLWSQVGRPNDRLGVTYFRTTVDEPLINGERLPMLAGNVASLVTHVNGQNVVPANLTAMGGGLQRSIEALRALPAEHADARHVILFSDGMQNVNPMVLPPQHVEINDEPGRPASGVLPIPIRLDQLSPLKIDTIAVGTGAFTDVLSDIAAQGQGLAQQTLDANDLRQFFVEQLIDTLRGASPQLIGYRRGALRGASTTESFQINRGARKLLFKVSWQRGQALDARAFKDGVDMTSSAQVVAGEFYRILAINTPINGLPDSASGEWRLRISGKPGTAYEAAAIIEDKELRYQVRFERTDGQAGAPPSLVVQVSKNGRPIDGPISLTATITRPRVAIGKVLATMKPLKAGSRGSEPGMTDGERQVAAFLQDKKRRNGLKLVTEKIRLEGDSRGSFRAVLANASVPGLYRAEVRISGDDHQLGHVERSQSATLMVRFGEADRARSAIMLRTLRKSPSVELTLRPADRLGNLLGPTFASHIALALSAGKVDRGSEDLGDGRYRFVLSPPDGQDPTLTLAVSGRPLFRGTIKQLRDTLRR